MIDTWLIFALVIPFMEVILHTRIVMIQKRLDSLGMTPNMVWGSSKDNLEKVKKREINNLRYKLPACRYKEAYLVTHTLLLHTFNLI